MAQRRAVANGARVVKDLHILRSIGGVDYDPKSFGGDSKPKGVVRPALTVADLQARKWFVNKCQEAGLRTRVDKFGTVLGQGDASLRLLCGSHSDTQITGGWLDGSLGCIYALEAARAFKEAGLPAAIDVINFQDEEGRFGTLTGSTACTGGKSLDLDTIALSGTEKITLDLALQVAAPLLRDMGAEEHIFQFPFSESDHILKNPQAKYRGFFEAHIEQGRRLERAEKKVAAVSSIVGLRQIRLEALGEKNHAGSTLMMDRRDSGRALVHALARIDETFTQLVTSGVAPSFVWSFPVLHTEPGAPSIIPNHGLCVLQYRDPDDDILTAATEAVKHIVEGSTITPIVMHNDRPPLKPTQLDSSLLSCIEDSIRYHGDSDPMILPSGAIHDASSLANYAQIPTAMLFIPSINGISHSFDEDTADEDIAHGAQVYVDAAARMLGFIAR
mmetsp:Transcript_5366/g.7892  ORF Transcript_5366/g.7892 Transcript_5366/m.7892 type:complete len:445 (+) Transcript_5366:1040-2374(+)